MALLPEATVEELRLAEQRQRALPLAGVVEEADGEFELQLGRTAARSWQIEVRLEQVLENRRCSSSGRGPQGQCGHDDETPALPHGSRFLLTHQSEEVGRVAMEASGLYLYGVRRNEGVGAEMAEVVTEEEQSLQMSQ